MQAYADLETGARQPSTSRTASSYAGPRATLSVLQHDSGLTGSRGQRFESPETGHTKELYSLDLARKWKKNRSRRQGASIGAAIFLLLALPFGPVLMTIAAIFGALLGASVGVCVDLRYQQKQREQVQMMKTKLKDLLVKGVGRFGSPEEAQVAIEEIVPAFHGMATAVQLMAGERGLDSSKIPNDESMLASKLLRRLYHFLCQDKVHAALWIYMEDFLSRWRVLHLPQFLFVVEKVFGTLIVLNKMMVSHGKAPLDVVNKMDQFCSHPSVEELMQRASELDRTKAEQQKQQAELKLVQAVVELKDADAIPSGRFTTLLPGTNPLASGKNWMSPTPRTPDSTSRQNSSESESSGPDEVAQVGKTPSGRPKGEREWIEEEEPEGESFSLEAFQKLTVAEKHALPICKGERILLTNIEEDKNALWETCVEKDNIRVEKLAKDDSPTVIVRAWAKLYGIAAENAMYNIGYFPRRSEWDKVLVDLAVIQARSVPEFPNDVIYSVFKGYMGVTSRDFLQWRYISFEPDGSGVIIMRSATHPQAAERKNFIRAETTISGYALRPMPDGQGCSLFLVSQTDIKGLIPKWIVNMSSGKAPVQWVEQLSTACKDFSKSKPNADEILSEWAKQYLEKPKPTPVPKAEEKTEKKVKTRDEKQRPSKKARSESGASGDRPVREEDVYV